MMNSPDTPTGRTGHRLADAGCWLAAGALLCCFGGCVSLTSVADGDGFPVSIVPASDTSNSVAGDVTPNAPMGKLYPPPTADSLAGPVADAAVANAAVSHAAVSHAAGSDTAVRQASAFDDSGVDDSGVASGSRYVARQFPVGPANNGAQPSQPVQQVQYGQPTTYGQGSAYGQSSAYGQPAGNGQTGTYGQAGTYGTPSTYPGTGSAAGNGYTYTPPTGPPLPPGSSYSAPNLPPAGQPNPYAPPQPAPSPSYPQTYGQTTVSPPRPVVSYQNAPNVLNTPSIGDNIFGPGTGPGAAPAPPLFTPTVREADLIINGYPARTGRIMIGGAVNSDAGVTGQITVDERNFDITRWPRSFQDLFSGTAFRGAGETFRLEAAPGSDFQRYTINYAQPNLFRYLPFSFSISGFLYDRRFTDWDENRLGARTSLGYRITPDLSLAVGVSGQNVEVSNPRQSVAPLNAVLGDNTLFSGNISLTHDTRNSAIQASSGHYFEFSFEEAFGDFDYARFELEYRQYWLLAERADSSGKQTISYSTQLGFSGDDTPIFENFFAGGYATIRGFDFRGASPVDSGVEVGGRFQWLNSIEYMFPITADDAFRGVAFVDFGTVESDIEINEENFRVAPGVGFRVAIPMLGPAPLAFDFAFPVAKADTDDERMFSFYMSLIR